MDLLSPPLQNELQKQFTAPILLHTCERVLQRANPAVKARLQPLSTQNAFACRVLFNLSAPDETVSGGSKNGVLGRPDKKYQVGLFRCMFTPNSKTQKHKQLPFDNSLCIS